MKTNQYLISVIILLIVILGLILIQSNKVNNSIKYKVNVKQNSCLIELTNSNLTQKEFKL